MFQVTQTIHGNEAALIWGFDGHLEQWFSNFLHQVPPQKIFGFPSTTIMTNIKMQYKWLPTAPCVCVCVCVCVDLGRIGALST